MIARDLFLKETMNGKTNYRACRVWDAERFIAAQKAFIALEDPKGSLTILTEEEYNREAR